MVRKSLPKKGGFTLLELLVSLAMFAMIMIISGLAVTQSNAILLSSNGREGAMRELGKARKWLKADLELTNLSSDTFQTALVPASQGAGKDGDAIDFLSPIDPNTQKEAYANDGSNFWMRNISYYLVVPANHDTLAGQSCVGVKEVPSGYDDGCPHKVLMRQLTDQNSSDPANPPTIQKLLTAFGTFTRPTGYPRSTALNAVAINLLSFRVKVVNPGELSIDLRAVSQSDATRNIAVGGTLLTPTSYCIQQVFSIYPNN